MKVIPNKNLPKSITLRLPMIVLENILDAIIRDLLPEEHKAGKVSAYSEFWYSDTGVPVDSAGVLLKENGRSFTLFEANEWSDDLPNGKADGLISVSNFWVTHWYEGSMKNQSFLYMKSYLIQQRFNSYIREFLKDR